MLTPSSNTVLEPLTAAMLADLPDVTAHFARAQRALQGPRHLDEGACRRDINSYQAQRLLTFAPGLRAGVGPQEGMARPARPLR
jgi:hypothetical protein